MVGFRCGDQSQHFVRYRASLNCDLPLFAKLHQKRMLGDAETVTDALGVEKDSIVQV